MWWNANGEEGMILSRCAFACMIKIMSLTDDLMAFVDEVQMQKDLAEAEEPDEIQAELAKKLKDMSGYDQIFARWEASS